MTSISQSLKPFRDMIAAYIKSGHQTIRLLTHEEGAAANQLRQLCDEIKMKFVRWDIINGFIYAAPKNTPPSQQQDMIRSLTTLGTDNEGRTSALPIQAMTAMVRRITGEDGQRPRITQTLVLVSGAYDIFPRDRVAVQAVRNAIFKNLISGGVDADPSDNFIVFLQPRDSLDLDLDDLVTSMELPLPTVSELQDELTDLCSDSGVQIGKNISTEDVAMGARTALGLTRIDATNMFSLCIKQAKDAVNLEKNKDAKVVFNPDRMESAKASKLIDRLPSLHFTPRSQLPKPLVGFENLLSYVEDCREAYTPEGMAQLKVLPRGVAVIGRPGTGKSVMAEAVAAVLGMPLIRIDINALFGSLIGQTEQNTRRALQAVVAMQGSVLFLDELDKAFGNCTRDSGDSGVRQRMFSMMLTWLSRSQRVADMVQSDTFAGNSDWLRRPSPTFVIATLNRADVLAQETLRTGRFDCLFYTDLPNEIQRQQIFVHHLGMYGPIPEYTEPQWKTLIANSNLMVGSDIETAVLKSRQRAFATRKIALPHYTDLLDQLTQIKPAAAKSNPDIDDMMKFAREYGVAVCPEPTMEQLEKFTAQPTISSPVLGSPTRNRTVRGNNN